MATALIAAVVLAAGTLLFADMAKGADSTAPDMTTVDAAFTHGKKNYFFYSKWYYRYHHGKSVPDSGYPVRISHAWKGMPKAFQHDIDAVFLWSKKKVYFFKGDACLTASLSVPGRLLAEREAPAIQGYAKLSLEGTR